MSAHAFYLPALGGVAPPPVGPQWPLANREPLPPPPKLTDSQPPEPQGQCWSKEPYDSALPDAPDHPDRFFCRGNFCLLVPGFTGGWNDKDRRVVMTWDIPTMPEADQDYVLNYYATVFTHLLLSIPHGKNNGMTLDQLTASAKKAKARGLFLIMNAVSDGDNFDVAIPWLDHLVAEGGLVGGQDGVCFCWQVDKYYPPPRICEELIAQSAYCVPRNLMRLIHWLNSACAYWTPEDEHDPDGSCMRFDVCDRFGFQRFAVNYLDIHLGQLDQNAAIDQLQSNDAKVLQSLPPPLRLCAAEQGAQAVYDTPSDRIELYARQKARYVMASRYQGQTLMGGYMNDCSRDDGSPL